MTHLLFALLLGITLHSTHLALGSREPQGSLMASQPASANFAGTWVADLKGVTFMRLELRTADGRLIGAIGTGNIHADANGVVVEAEPAPKTLTPMANITIARDTMSFTRVEGDDVERFRLRVTGKDTAELTFLLSDEDLEELKDEGIPAPKPIPLRRR